MGDRVLPLRRPASRVRSPGFAETARRPEQVGREMPRRRSAGMSTAAFIDLDTMQRWVNWRNEQRGDDHLTKVPYQPNGRKAKANDPSTWSTRAVVEAAVPKIVTGLGGGIGLELGD